MTQAIEIIPAYNVASLKKSIDRLNRKAAKLGTSGLVLTVEDTEPYRTMRHPITGNPLMQELVIEQKKVTLDYEIPTLDGWELVAQLDVYENTVLVSAVPGMEVPEEYKNLTEISCDHCGHNRYRTHSIIIHHESGEYKQVGSTCVKDFFAGNDPKAFMFKASIMFDRLIQNLRDEFPTSYGTSFVGFSLKTILTWTSAAVRKFGWLSRGKAYQMGGGKATADRVLDNLYDSPFMDADDRLKVDEDDEKRADAAIEWWNTTENTNNDYMMNCIKILSMGWVPDKYIGFACSMLTTAEREINKAEEKVRRQSEQGESNWVGEINQRLKGIKVKVLFTKEIDSDWGCSTLYTFIDEDGNVFKTFYSGSSWGAEKGNIIYIDGTVKRHCEYKGEKQTMLNRVNAKTPDVNDMDFNFKTNELIEADEFKVA